MSWTAHRVKKWLEEAALTFRHWQANTPAPRPKAYGSNWPSIVRQAIEAYGYDEARARAPVPTGVEIARMDQAFGWFELIDEEDHRLLWDRANRKPWWKIAQKYGRSERWAQRRHDRACRRLAFELNERVDDKSDNIIKFVRSLS